MPKRGLSPGPVESGGATLGQLLEARLREAVGEIGVHEDAGAPQTNAADVIEAQTRRLGKAVRRPRAARGCPDPGVVLPKTKAAITLRSQVAKSGFADTFAIRVGPATWPLRMFFGSSPPVSWQITPGSWQMAPVPGRAK